MENSTPNPEHHQHHAHHSLEDDNKKPSSKRSIEFSSPLAQPPVTNSPPAHLRGDGHKDPREPERRGLDLLSVPLDELKDRSATVICPRCEVRTRTITEVKSGNVTHLTAGVLVVASVLLLAWVPYVISGLKNVLHYCGNCNLFLAEYHRSGRTEVARYSKANGR
ncbi:litaf zinc finger [Fusarium denticulatum]|uniref:Litaf zinc finger n=1 Tax=Fusarium denticulatum TaxID=48507 RepID=A0A8H5WGL8_9HYPO|nr:litaf zinc finger [Fusarium denticulatum]